MNVWVSVPFGMPVSLWDHPVVERSKKNLQRSMIAFHVCNVFSTCIFFAPTVPGRNIPNMESILCSRTPCCSTYGLPCLRPVVRYGRAPPHPVCLNNNRLRSITPRQHRVGWWLPRTWLALLVAPLGALPSSLPLQWLLLQWQLRWRRQAVGILRLRSVEWLRNNVNTELDESGLHWPDFLDTAVRACVCASCVRVRDL